MKRFFSFLLLIIMLTSCTSPTLKTPTQVVEQKPWWQTAIFYEIFVRSFYDSNGDGIGDFNGILAKLDYLNSLGVNAIWLMPINPSPSYHGYDVINYYNVNPQYGSMDDFKRLLDEVHKRDMHLIIDLVINHTSNQNPLFIDANNNPDSPYRDWFIWSESDPGYSGPMGYPWHPGAHGFYYGVFSDRMPDFNYRNPDVTAQMLKVVKFWLNDVGVDGFRVDAVKYLIEEGQKQENTASTHEWLKNFYTAYKADNPEAFAVGEVWGAGAFTAKTYLNQLDEIFSFEMAGGFVNSAQGGSNTAMNSAVTFTLKDMPNGPFATFLTNHDQNRVMSVVSGKVEKAKIAAALMFTSPGTPFIYYGEEVGMEGMKPDQDIRRPMQWTNGMNAGFSTGKPWRALGQNYPIMNVASETADPQSLLSFYKQMINLRNEHSVLKDGELIPVTTKTTGIFAMLRSNPGETIMVVVNLTKSIINNYALHAEGITLKDGSYKLKALFGAEAGADMRIKSGTVTGFIPVPSIPAYGILIYQLVP